MSRGCEAKVEVVAKIADIAAEAWDACANPDPATFNPFIAHGFLKALEDAGSVGGRTGWTPRHLVLRPAPDEIAGCAPGLPQDAQPGRICVRPQLGRRLRARRRRLLSQAADRRAVHARARPPAAGAPGCRSGKPRRPARGGRKAGRRAQQAFGRAHHLPRRGPVAKARRTGLPAAHRPAVPLGQCGLRQLRRVPGLARLAQTQDHAQGARAGRRGGARHRVAEGPRDCGSRLGRLLRLLHADGIAQVGATLSEPQVLLTARPRARWGSAAC